MMMMMMMMIMRMSRCFLSNLSIKQIKNVSLHNSIRFFIEQDSVALNPSFFVRHTAVIFHLYLFSDSSSEIFIMVTQFQKIIYWYITFLVSHCSWPSYKRKMIFSHLLLLLCFFLICYFLSSKQFNNTHTHIYI